jgi:hypothetical protein
MLLFLQRVIREDRFDHNNISDPINRNILFHLDYTFGPNDTRDVEHRIKCIRGVMEELECNYTASLLRSRGPEDEISSKYFSSTLPNCPGWYQDVASLLEYNIPSVFEEEYIQIRTHKSAFPLDLNDLLEMCRHMCLEDASPLYYTMRWMTVVSCRPFPELHDLYLKYVSISPTVWRTMSDYDKRKIRGLTSEY